MEINRDFYLKILIAKKHNGLIKVITGMRRCGKSYLLLTLFKQHLLECGVAEDHIIEIPFDSFENKKYRDPEVLYVGCVDNIESLMCHLDGCIFELNALYCEDDPDHRLLPCESHSYNCHGFAMRIIDDPAKYTEIPMQQEIGFLLAWAFSEEKPYSSHATTLLKQLNILGRG